MKKTPSHEACSKFYQFILPTIIELAKKENQIKCSLKTK